MLNRYELIHEAWKEYMKSRTLAPIVSPYITLSWERCFYNDIDPYDPLTNVPVLSEEELRSKQERRIDLMESASPFLDTLYQSVKGSGFMVILTDEQGYILKLHGDPEIIQNTKELNFYPGSNWSEETRGTNAIGTAIVARRPLQVYGTEHYCKALHHLTCSAAPIFDSNDILIGVLDVTGPYQFAHPHTLGMVVSAVAAIQKQLVNMVAKDEMASAYRKLNTIMESMNEGVIAINRHGVITHCNTLAAELLNTNPEKCLGRAAADIFGADNILERVLREKGKFEGRELVVNTPKGRVTLICSAKTYKDAKDRTGVIAIMFEQKRVHRLVSAIAGTHSRFTFSDVVGSSQEIKKVVDMARKVARNDSTVLLLGESGTGKEIFAQAIHSHSDRKNEPFIAINCAAIPRALVESELFGYEEGSFTGGRKGGRPGKLELANGGTIFLDEIGDMPLEIQGSLLRFLQERKITRVGGHKDIPLDVRVIAATHKDMMMEVEKGNFRLDLFYRLNVVVLKLPSLRERKDDIIPLAEYFLRRYSNRMGKPEPIISEEATWLLYNYDWPGNVRELENTIEQAMNILEGKVLSASLLAENIKKVSRLDSDVANRGLLKENEVTAIKQAIQLCQGNLTKSAKCLGIGRATLYRKMKILGIASIDVSK